MIVQELAATVLQQKIETGKLIIVDFYAEWCGPCKQISPILDGLANEAGDRYEIYKIDVDKEDSKEFLVEQVIMSIPTVIFFKDGVRVHAFVGLQDKKTIQEMIAKFA